MPLRNETGIDRIEPSGDRQALVANIDSAFLVMGLDGDFNLRRLERYLARVKAAHVIPVMVRDSVRYRPRFFRL